MSWWILSNPGTSGLELVSCCLVEIAATVSTRCALTAQFFTQGDIA